jgi:lipoteichoic acid synthase
MKKHSNDIPQKALPPRDGSQQQRPEPDQKRVHTKQSIAVQTAAILFMPVVVIYFEVLFSIFLEYSITLYTIAFSISIASLLFALSFILKYNWLHTVLQGIFTCALAVMYLSQFLYFRIFKVLYVLESLKGAGKAASFADILFAKMRENIFPIILFLVPVLLFFTVQRSFLRKIKFSYFLPAAGLAVFFVMFVGSVAGILQDKSEVISPRYIYRSEFIQDKSLERFGLFTTMRLDFRYNVMNISYQENNDFDVGSIDIIEATTDPSQSSSPTPTQTEAIPSQSEAEVVVYEPNVMDIDFNLEETNATYLEMNKYFALKAPTLKNEYTGMFEGKNLILLTAEGFSKFVIDPELTPTLYKLSTEGFVFNHFYTPIWGVSTSDGEFVASTGLIPKAGKEWSYTAVADNYMPFAFGNQFKELGYVTNAYHNHTYTYYNRDLSYPNMGYNYKGLGSGLNVTKMWPESDLEMMEVSVPEYAGESNFHIYYMTVSGHLEYNFGGNAMSKKNKDLVADLPYSEHVRAYIACQIELDLALENLLLQLEANGQLENTVIALSADHYPYGLEAEEYDELAGHELGHPFEFFENSFILWAGDMKEPIVVDKYCSSLDIAPTLSNLFGLTYDSRLYFGTDIMSTTSPVVVFQGRSFITDKIMYDSGSNSVQKLTSDEITEAYIEDSIQRVKDEFKYSALVISEDYYRYLLE